MAENEKQAFASWQQSLGFALFSAVFTRRSIGLLIGGSGVGKSYLIREFKAYCARRGEIEHRRRRVIPFEEALGRFEAAGLFERTATAVQREWLLERFGYDERRRASPFEVAHWLQSFRALPGAPPIPLEEEQLSDDEPADCPIVKVLSPPSILGPSGLVRMLYDLLGRPRGVANQYTEKMLMAAYEEFRSLRSILLIVDHAERLRPETLLVLREIHSDGEAPVCLCGTAELEATLRKPMLASLRRRIAIAEEIGPLTGEQVREFLPDLPMLLSARLHEVSEGNFATLLAVLDAARQVAAVNDASRLALEHVDEGARLVPDARRHAPRRDRTPAPIKERHSSKAAQAAQAAAIPAPQRRRAAR